MRPDYIQLNLDLAVARTREPIVPRGALIRSVTVLSDPTGAGATLAFYNSGPEVALAQEGQRFEDVCSTEGLWLSNTAGAGVLQLFVSFDALGAQGGS